jgi:hypothetical protein
MKKKHLNIPLFILVLFIYGSVFFKFFGKKGVQIEDTPYNNMLSKQVSDFETKRNDFDISNIKSDPFGISEKRIRKSTTSQLNGTVKSTKKIAAPIAWPNITYFGFVKNNINTTRLALVKVNNKLHRKRENEKIDDISIVNVYNDSIRLRLNKTTKTILKINE